MVWRQVIAGFVMLSWAVPQAPGQADAPSLTNQHWFEVRTAHFNLYSCGQTQEVFKLSARLEQFHDAYSLLAGAQAVTSPPIIVMAFPDIHSMQPFLPLYEGKPINLSGFFKRDDDENLIALALSGTNRVSLAVIFHEYAHLLLRRNDRVWPLWLNEGMAEIYATFDAAGREVRFGLPIERHLRLLAETPLVPLAELFAVTHDSPQYNEREHQGIFYAESWLLTHYLMLGGVPARKAGLGELTRLLRQGQASGQAFTNAFRTSLPAMENELRGYLNRGRFEPIHWTVGADLSAPRAAVTRGLSSAEASVRLGNLLLRIDRLDTAESFFTEARKLAPASPLPYEGLGLLAAERHKPDEAARFLQDAFQRGSTNFLAHYLYARERYRLTADSGDRYSPLPKDAAVEIRAELQKSLALMPDFGPAHQLLGFFEMVQGEDLAAAEQHLQKAIQLEPENQWHLLSLAQVELRKDDPAAARRALEPLRLPFVEAKLRARAEEMLREIGR
jgi:tetratricopeptide (TPR) repeat protein